MTIEVFTPPSQTGYLTNNDGKVVGTITLGGEILKMPCRKKIQHFEMHKWFGPVPCNQDGEEAERKAADFWDRYEQWDAGGRLVDGDLCVIRLTTKITGRRLTARTFRSDDDRRSGAFYC